MLLKSSSRHHWLTMVIKIITEVTVADHHRAWLFDELLISYRLPTVIACPFGLFSCRCSSVTSHIWILWPTSPFRSSRFSEPCSCVHKLLTWFSEMDEVHQRTTSKLQQKTKVEEQKYMETLDVQSECLYLRKQQQWWDQSSPGGWKGWYTRSKGLHRRIVSRHLQLHFCDQSS